MPLTDDTADLRRKLTHADAVIAEIVRARSKPGN
jgi:hypothetical protein